MTGPAGPRGYNDASKPGYRSLRELSEEAERASGQGGQGGQTGLAGEQQNVPSNRRGQPARPAWPERPAWRPAASQPEATGTVRLPGRPAMGRPPMGQPPMGQPPMGHPLLGPPPVNTSQSAPGRRRRPRRHRGLLVLVLVVVLVALLGVGGYFGYQQLSPYFGAGYRTGSHTTVDDVKLTLASAQCGKSSVSGSSIKPIGQFCTVDVTADNLSNDGAFVDFNDWSVNLDVGINDITPSVDAMALPIAVIYKGDNQTLDLVFDVPTGARLSGLNISIGIHTGIIRMSVA